ncbi:MAG: DUF2284 domain-containing protein, partial [Peptostreptococcaceae bacterium]
SDINKFIDFEYFTGLCKDGCPSYNTNWTCPPNSPRYEEYSKDYEKTLVMIMYSNINDDELSNVHINLRRTISPVLHSLEKNFNGLLTDGGRCMHCETCTCSDNLPCRAPELLRYSMESMGINLDALAKEVLNHKITWNKEENADNYCTVFGSVCFNGDYNEIDFEQYIRGL